MCKHIHSKEVIARKAWQCFGCERRFDKGTMKRCEIMRGDGRIYTLSLCEQCVQATHNLQYEDTYGPGELRDLWVNEVTDG